MKQRITFLFIVLGILGSSFAQSTVLATNTFWESNPDLKAVKAEVKKGFDFANMGISDDPIMLAIRNEADLNIITYLLEQPGVDIDKLVFEGRHYLHIAANDGNDQLVDYLLENGSDIDFLDANGHTAFTFAGFQGHLTKDMIDAFIKHGIDLNKKYPEKDGANILLISIPYDKDLTITDYLVSKGVSINSVDDDGNTAFNHAAKIGSVPMMKTLLERGVTYTDEALLIASQGTYRSANDIEVYYYLVDDLGVSPTLTSEEGQNVLHAIAKKNDQDEVINYFLSKGVDVNQQDEDGNTPFLNAAGGRSFKAVELMFSYLAEGVVNATNAQGQTALMLAAGSNAPEAVSFLIENGAEVALKDKRGNDAGFYLIDSYRAPRRGRGPTTESNAQNPVEAKLKTLLAAGYAINTLQEANTSLLHLAAEKNELTLVKPLVDNGIDLNVVNDNGNTALHIAAMKAENEKILALLVKAGADTSIETQFGETAYDLAGENEAISGKAEKLSFLK
ncbi:MAG: hypothetical protein CMF34_07490 [Leeuwenhoekiella sp.]|nr:hypothetical protein [Leeuwenhoekiella sp.]|tara:strand:+ start:6678 stop:8195 length:1518 start_codon:yes stop_codon:yes gene_type:complete